MNVEDLKHHARDLELKGEAAGALATYRQLVARLEQTQRITDDLPLYIKVGDLSLKLSDRRLALMAYERAAKLYAAAGDADRVLALCAKVLAVAPRRTQVYVGLVKIMLQRGHARAARAVLIEYASRTNLTHAVEALKRLDGADDDAAEPWLEGVLEIAERAEKARLKSRQLEAQRESSTDTAPTAPVRRRSSVTGIPAVEVPDIVAPFEGVGKGTAEIIAPIPRVTTSQADVLVSRLGDLGVAPPGETRHAEPTPPSPPESPTAGGSDEVTQRDLPAMPHGASSGDEDETIEIPVESGAATTEVDVPAIQPTQADVTQQELPAASNPGRAEPTPSTPSNPADDDQEIAWIRNSGPSSRSSITWIQDASPGRTSAPGTPSPVPGPAAAPPAAETPEEPAADAPTVLLVPGTAGPALVEETTEANSDDLENGEGRPTFGWRRTPTTLVGAAPLEPPTRSSRKAIIAAAVVTVIGGGLLVARPWSAGAGAEPTGLAAGIETPPVPAALESDASAPGEVVPGDTISRVADSDATAPTGDSGERVLASAVNTPAAVPAEPPQRAAAEQPRPPNRPAPQTRPPPRSGPPPDSSRNAAARVEDAAPIRPAPAESATGGSEGRSETVVRDSVQPSPVEAAPAVTAQPPVSDSVSTDEPSTPPAVVDSAPPVVEAPVTSAPPAEEPAGAATIVAVVGLAIDGVEERPGGGGVGYRVVQLVAGERVTVDVRPLPSGGSGPSTPRVVAGPNGLSIGAVRFESFLVNAQGRFPVDSLRVWLGRLGTMQRPSND